MEKSIRWQWQEMQLICGWVGVVKDGGLEMRPPLCHRMNLQTRQHVNACVSLGTARLSLQVPQKDKYFLLLVSRWSSFIKQLNFPEFCLKHGMISRTTTFLVSLGAEAHFGFGNVASNFQEIKLVISLFSLFIMGSLCGTYTQKTEPQ